ncbi:hypothetical protein [Lichenifustis flavocetrariae]|uniref:Uncharacterized protein n=1 Tax=Lichenifustis flavocetrariae TaxID=2949735 RepID=A0AA41Z361_9HYPH|nr:hypothetical protein [Lichenifustis flavocetrariae]MCW6509505.1 hypothetical protein [Lichenifustis flavocetrariae]
MAVSRDVGRRGRHGSGETIMVSIRKSLILACAVSVLGLGSAFAQTDPNAAPAAPAAGAAAAPAADAGADATAAPKKMMKKKHMSKKMMKKKTM